VPNQHGVDAGSDNQGVDNPTQETPVVIVEEVAVPVPDAADDSGIPDVTLTTNRPNYPARAALFIATVIYFTVTVTMFKHNWRIALILSVIGVLVAAIGIVYADCARTVRRRRTKPWQEEVPYPDHLWEPAAAFDRQRFTLQEPSLDEPYLEDHVLLETRLHWFYLVHRLWLPLLASCALIVGLWLLPDEIRRPRYNAYWTTSTTAPASEEAITTTTGFYEGYFKNLTPTTVSSPPSEPGATTTTAFYERFLQPDSTPADANKFRLPESTKLHVPWWAYVLILLVTVFIIVVRSLEWMYKSIRITNRNVTLLRTPPPILFWMDEELSRWSVKLIDHAEFEETWWGKMFDGGTEVLETRVQKDHKINKVPWVPRHHKFDEVLHTVI
jgi:hypothetical protein